LVAIALCRLEHVDRARTHNDDAEVEREEARLRSFVAPADPGMDAAHRDDQAEQRRRDRGADLHAALGRARTLSFTHTRLRRAPKISPAASAAGERYLQPQFPLARKPASFISSW